MKLLETSYYNILAQHAADAPDRPAIVMDDVRITYRELVDRIERVAAFMVQKGLQRGDKVALWASASPAWLYTYYGIIHAGGVAVILNANLTVKDAIPLVQFADTKYIWFGATHDIKGSASEAPALAEAFHIPEACVLSIPDTDLSQITPVPIDMTGRTPRDDAYIIYTSGTTAFPKAVVSSQYAITNIVSQLSKAIASVRGERAVLGVPLFHAYAIYVSWIYLSNGATLILPKRIKADVIANAVEKEDASDLWSVAPIYQGIIDNEVLTEKTAPRVRVCTIAGSYTSPVQFMRFEASLYNATFLNMYGMTETCATYTTTRPGDDIYVRYNTVGRTVDGVEAGAWSESKGLLPPGEVGEIVTRGYHLKNRYYKLPPEKQAIDEDGWLHSGDLGVFDEQGNLQIVGRIKDLIIKGGENLAPAEIEKEVMSHPSISGCRIFGFRDRIYGENLGACITIAPGETFDEKAVREYVKGKVGSYKSPVHYFIYDAFPLNANGKVDQIHLHEDMLTRLHRRILDNKLTEGICIADITIKNSTYNITPVAAMMEECAANLGFSKRRAIKVRGAAEEILIMRVNEADEIGDINVKLLYMHDFLRIVVTDPGMAFDPSREEQRKLSSAILLKLVDDFSWQVLPDGKYEVSIDFAYEQDWDIKGFLLKHQDVK